MLDTLTSAFLELIRDGRTYVVLLPVYSILLVGEFVTHQRLSDRRWNYYDAASNIVLTVAQLLVGLMVGWLLPAALMTWLYVHWRVTSVGTGWLGWLAAFLLYDLAWYIDHRIAHRVGFLWALHHIHHSSAEYNMTVASRGFLFDNTLLPRPVFYLLPLLGVAPLQFITMIVVTNIWGIAQHTRLVPRLGPLDWLLATPSNHRVHHGSDDIYLDRNYGEVLMVWDHLFGSYQREQQEPTYGVTEPIETHNPVRIQVAGLRWLAAKWRRASGPADKLRCLVMPPEWQPPSKSSSG